MRRTQAKHAKATPRGRVPRPTRRGRGGLLLGALAVLVAAIVAIPALSALAASTPVEYVKVTLPGSSYPPHDGAALYDDDVKVGGRDFSSTTRPARYEPDHGYSL